MALNFPVLLPQTGEALANYNYTDVSNGSGIEVYYLATTTSGGLLVGNTIYSHHVMSSGALVASDALNLVLTKDFDVLFNVPKNIKGTAFLSIPWVTQSKTTPATIYTQLEVKLKKWNGTTETVISQSSGAGQTTTVNVYNTMRMDTFEFPISLTHFKKGETLRLNVTGWGRIVSTGAGKIYIGHDPMNRASGAYDPDFSFGTETTKAQLNIPFKIDIGG